MSTVTVSIGRNVPGHGPLGPHYWDRFIHDVQDVVEAFAQTIYVDAAYSSGEWNGELEDSRTWVFATDGDWSERIVADLSVVATEYGQDAIAVTTGTTILAGLAAAV